MNGHRSLVYVRETLGWKAEHESLGYLHRALYEDGKNISSVEACINEIAKVKGVDPAAAMEALHGDAFMQEVLDENSYAKRQLRVQSVPHFYVEARGKTVELDGAVNAERWIQTVKGLVR
jgi:predicted DsbA family dithiol-disulfide isomerase